MARLPEVCEFLEVAAEVSLRVSQRDRGHGHDDDAPLFDCLERLKPAAEAAATAAPSIAPEILRLRREAVAAVWFHSDRADVGAAYEAAEIASYRAAENPQPADNRTDKSGGKRRTDLTVEDMNVLVGKYLKDNKRRKVKISELAAHLGCSQGWISENSLNWKAYATKKREQPRATKPARSGAKALAFTDAEGNVSRGAQDRAARMATEDLDNRIDANDQLALLIAEQQAELDAAKSVVKRGPARAES